MPDILDTLEVLVDDRVGIIREVRERRKDGGAPDLVYMSAATCNLNVLNPHPHQRVFLGSGTSTDRSSAMAKAVGEAVERYCSAMYSIGDLTLSSFESAQFQCVPPEDFALFSSEQYAQPGFPYRPFNRKTSVRWTPALDLCTRETHYVPSAMVFLPYDHKPSGETPITPQISSGLACHSNPTIAACSAICEVVERDAIAITWQAKISQPRLRKETLSLRNRELLTRLRQPGTSITLLYMSMDHGIPAIFSIMTSRVFEAPALVVAAAAHLDPEQAVQKSLEELAQIWCLSQRRKSERPKFSPGRRWENVIDPDSHAAVYFSHKNTHFAEFLWKSSGQMALSDIENLSLQDPSRDLRRLVEKITAVGHRVLLVDVTSEDVKNLGLWVFRALIPGFHPLLMGHRFRALGGARPWTVPKTLGYPGISREHGDNSAPHPFA